MVSLHVSAWHSPSLFWDQCLVKYSEWKRPDIILANTVAFRVSKLVLAVDQTGCGSCGYMRLQLLDIKKQREGSPEASPVKIFFHYEAIISFTCFLKLALVGGEASSLSGWSSPYIKHKSLIFRNQEFALFLAVTRTCLACAWSGSSGKWHIIQNSFNCFVCKIASPGMHPAMRNVKHRGVFL